MKGKQVPKAWIGRRVKVKLRTEGGGSYWVFGRLRSVNDEGIKLSPRFLPNASESRSSSKRPRASVTAIAIVRLLQISTTVLMPPKTTSKWLLPAMKPPGNL